MNEVTPSSDEKLWAGFAYVGLICCVIPTIVIFFLKKDESRFIKFSAMQALGFWLAMVVINVLLMTLTHIPVVGFVVSLVSIVVSLAMLAYWIYLSIQAFQGNEVEIPYLSAFIQENLMG